MKGAKKGFAPSASPGANAPPVQSWLQYGSRLINVRGEKSQAAFAPKLGVHKNTLGHYERGTRELGADALRSLVFLGWNANWLLTGEGPERLNDLDSVTDSSMASQPMNERFLTIALELGDEAAKHAGWAPKAEVARIVIDAYQALDAGATYAQLWQRLQVELDKTEPGGDASSGSQEEDREVRHRSSGTRRRR